MTVADFDDGIACREFRFDQGAQRGGKLRQFFLLFGSGIHIVSVTRKEWVTLALILIRTATGPRSQRVVIKAPWRTR